MHGSLTITVGGTGPAPGAGCGITITFNRPYGAIPKAILLTPANSGAAAQGGFPFVTAGASSFNVQTAQAPTSGLTLTWHYLVIE
jgi:hypothetical protein